MPFTPSLLTYAVTAKFFCFVPPEDLLLRGSLVNKQLPRLCGHIEVSKGYVHYRAQFASLMAEHGEMSWLEI